jgi:hypothetical protein
MEEIVSKFNKTVNSKINNLAGGVAYKNSYKHDLASIALNSYFNINEFYQNDKDRVNSIIEYINSGNSEFVAKLAVYTRSDTNLRSISHMLIVLLAENNDNSGNLRKMVYHSIKRVDDMTEIVALWNSRHSGKMLPNAIRRAFKDILNEKRFDEYQLKKYEQKRAKVKLKDIIKLAKPSKNLDLYKKVLESRLSNITTIHTNISKNKSAKDIFIDLYNKNKLGYLEVLKMSSKIFENGIDEELFNKYKNYILNEYRIKNSKVLSYRFYQSYVALWNIRNNFDNLFHISKNSRYTKNIANNDDLYIEKYIDWIDMFKQTLQKAFFISTQVESFIKDDEKIAIMIDDSYSMSDVSLGLSLYHHALLFTTTIASNINPKNLKLYFWSDRCEEMSIDKDKPFEFVQNATYTHRGTYVDMPFKLLIEDKVAVDKAIVFTDCQMYGYDHIDVDFKTYIDQYKKEVNSNTKVLFWDLAGYNSGTPVKISDDIVEANGISSKMLSLVPKLWNDKDALIKDIEKIKL